MVPSPRSLALSAALLAALSLAAGGAAGPAGSPREALAAETWVGGDPIPAEALRGRPVLVSFWTFGCVNCVRTVPAVRALHDRYAPKGLVVLGVHSPEFDRERDAEAVRRECARLGVTWPSLIDNDFRIWRAFRNAYWPSLYLLDGEGKVVWSHVGELHEGTPAWDAARAAVERSLASL